MEEEELEFKISTGLKDIIGKDLITDEFIAVFELVKNSYDAFAKKVIITIEDDKLIIADNGKGMSYDDLENKWLFVAYSAKKDKSEDNEDDLKSQSYRDLIQERKHFAGSKGIGRFSSDSLGELLIIKTKKRNANIIEELKIDWAAFESNQKEKFETVKVKHRKISSISARFPDNSKSGTILEISTLHKDWDRKRILSLKHSLEKLINPFYSKNDFSIEIKCDKELKKDKSKKLVDRDKVNGPIKNAILDILELKTSQIYLTIKDSFIETKIIDRGELIYEIQEPSKDFEIIEDLKVELYFLNTSAKNNFTRKMGIRVVNFGSVFLFKNGFRVQPYGEFGDDSWGIDQRKQQGYNRFLGTRDLFGRVSINTNNTQQFKEVSNREGGLIETKGYFELLKAFSLAHRRLERYVVGVLWGEGFKKRKYFGDDLQGNEIAESYRAKLSSDKHSENIEIAKSNLGSKLDFIQIIKSLTNNKEIKIIDFNRDFVDLLNEKLDDTQHKFIGDLKVVAERIGDAKLGKEVDKFGKAFEKLVRGKEKAEEKAKQEEARRKEAEEKAKQEEARRKEAENENAKRKEQWARRKSADSVEYEDLRDSNHIIGVYSDLISKKILRIKRKMDKNNNLEREELLEFISGVSLANEKIGTITRYTTKSDFIKATLETTDNIVNFIHDYIQNTYKVLFRLKVEFINQHLEFEKTFKPIELTLVIDNILSNARKKNADKVIVEFNVFQGLLKIDIRDVGAKLSNKLNSEIIFEEGITTTRGSGLGLSHVKRIIEEDLNGTIKHNSEYKEGFELNLKLKK